MTAKMGRFHIKRFRYVRALDLHYSTDCAFAVLGSNAAPAIPRLIAIYDRCPSPFVRQEIPLVLVSIGPAARSATPLLLRAATSEDIRVRANALAALGSVCADPQMAIPTLIDNLTNLVWDVPAYAAWSLGQFGAEAKAAIPALLRLVTTCDNVESNEPYTVQRPFMRSWPESGVPAVARRDFDFNTIEAMEAIWRIDHVAAERNGIHCYRGNYWIGVNKSSSWMDTAHS